MTNELRALKIRQLARISHFVEGKESIEEFGQAVLKWPHPKTKQHAVIDVNTGKITQFVHQTGTVAEDVHPKGWYGMIDRRIKYLAHLHREHLNE